MSGKKTWGPVSEKQRLALTDTTTDILLIGGGAGGGKSHTCLMKNLDSVHDPNFRCTIFRRSYPELKRQGGLIDESKKVYSEFKARYLANPPHWKFPSGAQIQFAQFSCDDDMGSWQGAQLSRILIDEAADKWEERHVLFLLSRLRSDSKSKSQMIMTCNPDINSFLKKWVEYCLDPDTGVPIEGTENIIRWMINIDGEVFWGDSPEEVYELHGKPRGKVFAYGLSDEEIKLLDVTTLCIPKSFRFIPTGVLDNKYLLPPRNTTYLASLLAQPRVNQLKYLHGSWTAKEEGAGHFRRDWVKLVDMPPARVTKKVRAWDLAATEKSESNPNPDWTVGVLMSKDHLGNYYIEDMKRFRKLANGVLEEVINTAHEDDKNVTDVSLPRDTGAGGASAYQFQARALAENGVVVRQSKMSGHSSKLNRFLPFAAMAEAGLVFVVRGDWNNDFFTELENFVPGNRNQKDDIVDATSDAFNTISKSIDIPTFVVPNTSQMSIAQRMK